MRPWPTTYTGETDTPATIALPANLLNDIALAPGDCQQRKGRNRRPRVSPIHNENNLGRRIVCIQWLDRPAVAAPQGPLYGRFGADVSELHDEMILWYRSQTDHAPLTDAARPRIADLEGASSVLRRLPPRKASALQGNANALIRLKASED